MSEQKQQLSMLQDLRVTLEEEREQVHKEMEALKKKVELLEQENARLKKSSSSSAAAASTTSSSSSSSACSGKVPFGHTPFSWAGDLGTNKVPFGHSAFSWAGGAAAKTTAAPSASASAACPSGNEVKTEGFLARISIKNVFALDEAAIGKNVNVCGWAKTVRLGGGGKLAFIELNDGSCFKNLQVVVSSEVEGWAVVEKNTVTGTCFMIKGDIVASPAAGQKIEMQATSVTLLGGCPGAEYPLAKGKHSLEHLRTVGHLRPRTNTIGAMMRVRNCLAFAIHNFFQQRQFFYVHAPLITSSDCEGAGEMFAVTTLLADKPSAIPVTPEGKIDYSKDFFASPTFLTVSGQLEGEAYACAMGKIYTFGPTFRAEVSHTPRHLAEFWMIEPEIAFANLDDVMDLGEAFLKHCCSAVLEHCQEDLEFFEKMYLKTLRDRLREVVEKDFVRLPYKQALEHLLAAKREWEFPPKMGEDLASEHERYLTEELVKGPVFVTNWPKGIKSFYMRLNEDNETVAAVDCLLPKVGEIIGGSQREERMDVLTARMKEMNVSEQHLKWFLDLRKFGSCPHAGFGLGFERLVLFCTGLENIRDVIPFPRYPGHAEF